MNDRILEELFKKRIVESNIFTQKEREKIGKDFFVCQKCYYLGKLDGDSFLIN